MGFETTIFGFESPLLHGLSHKARRGADRMCCRDMEWVETNPRIITTTDARNAKLVGKILYGFCALEIFFGVCKGKWLG